jgi:hypothetical protein
MLTYAPECIFLQEKLEKPKVAQHPPQPAITFSAFLPESFLHL